LLAGDEWRLIVIVIIAVIEETQTEA